MTRKRRNHGRNKPPGGRGHVKRVCCEASGAMVPKDKAIKRFVVRNIVDASAIRDIQDCAVIEGYVLPKIYRKVYYSISAGIHSRIVRVRSRKQRKLEPPALMGSQNREPPPRWGRPREGPGSGAGGGGGRP